MSFEAEGFRFKGGDEGVIIEDDLADYLVGVAAAPIVAADGDPIVFDVEESGDFSNGELGPHGSVSKKVESERSFTVLVAQAFLLIRFGTKEEEGVLASIAI